MKWLLFFALFVSTMIPANPGTLRRLSQNAFSTTYRYSLDQDLSLPCKIQDLFQFSVPTRGFAIAKVSANIQHIGSSISDTTHFWSLAVKVGSPEYKFAIGDDLCPGYGPFEKVNLGIGTLNDSLNAVTVAGHIGSDLCIDGILIIKSGSYVELVVYNSDFTPPIFYNSWMKEKGTQKYFDWGTLAQTLTGQTVITTETKRVRVLAVVEGTPHDNPNKFCGQERATLMSRILLDKKVLKTVSGVINASKGMGHLVRFFDFTTELEPGIHQFELQVGANFLGKVTTGGCCGDGVLAVLPEAG